MKRLSTLCALALAIAASPARADGLPANSVFLSFSSIPGGAISFDPATDSFTFTTDRDGYSFQVTSASSTVPSLSNPVSLGSGILGRIEGAYTISGISSTGPNSESATLTGSAGAKFVLNDGFATLTGDLTAQTIASSIKPTGTTSYDVVFTLSNVAYEGSNALLSTLADLGNAGGVITLNIPLSASLTTITTTGTNGDLVSYSGSLVASTPVPAAWLMMGVGSAILGAARVLRRKTTV
jgi:hypothetical protein